MRRCACLALALAMGTPSLSAAATPAPPSLSVRAAALVAPATGQLLYGANADTQLPIASTTKLMTALVTLQHASMSQVFTYPGLPLSAADSQIGLAAGERMSVYDLFVAMLVPSADDAAYDLAFNVGHGSVGSFVAMMNSEAAQLGLTHTHYSTPIGLDTPGNYSSASDLVKLASYLLKQYPLFARVVALPSAVLHSGSHVRVVVSRNDLVGHDGIFGVKTGYTLGAGYVLVASARHGNLTLLSAVLGTFSMAARDQNTLALLGWGYSSFRLAKLITAGAVLARPAVADQPGTHAVVIATTSLSHVIATGARIKIDLALRHPLAGPIARGVIVGNATVFADGKRIGTVPLALQKAIPTLSPLTRVARFVTRASTLVLLALLLCVAAVLVVRRRQQRQAHRNTA